MIFEALLLVLSVFTELAASRNGCRRCGGGYQFLFNDYFDEARARDFLKGSLSFCATGSQFLVTGVQINNCVTPGSRQCKFWNFDLEVYRYCGNGSSVTVGRSSYCVGTVCARAQYLSLKCSESVDCKERCNCYDCGC